MCARLSKVIKKGEYMKALYIYFRLVWTSQSFKNMSYLFQPVSKELEQYVEKLFYEEQRLWDILMKNLDDLLRQLEVMFGAWIILLYAGTQAKVHKSVPIEDLSSLNHDNGLLLFITIIIMIMTIIMTQRKEAIKIVVEGPMSQQEYVNLQDVLAYQAWLDNLALSPIGKLWELPF
jgi:hypothetical protein